MGINSLLNQTASLYNRSGTRDRYGKPAYGAARSIRCRFQQVKKTIVNAQKETEPIDGEVFIMGDETVSIGDKFTYNSIDYRVMSCSPIILGNGATNHIELKVQLWETA